MCVTFFLGLKTKKGWFQVNRTIKRTSLPKGYQDTHFISDETFLFDYGDTEGISAIINDNEYYDYVTLFLSLYNYLKETTKIPFNSFLTKNPKFDKLVNDYNLKDNKLEFGKKETYMEKEFLYSLISRVHHNHLDIINQSCSQHCLKIEIKTVTSCLINIYYGECENPFERIKLYPSRKQMVLKVKLDEIGDFVMCVIDPLLYNHLENEKMLVQLSKKNPFDFNYNSNVPRLIKSTLKLDQDTKNWCCIFFYYLFSESNFVISNLQEESK